MVEWKRLGEFASLQKTKNKAHVTENAYSITQNGLVPTKSFFKEKTIITSSDTKGYYIVEKDWFVYSPSRIDVGSINYLRDEGPVIVSPIDVVFSIDKEQCLPPYLLSYFLSHNGKRDMLKNRQGVEGMGRRNLPFSAIENMIIPIPSLAEQERIVGILDIFTAAIDNLKKQIELRKKQFEKYRDELLDLEGKEGMEMKIEEFCFLKAGKSLKKEEISSLSEDNTFPCYGGNGIRGFVPFFSHDGEFPIIGRQGALCGCVNWATGKFYATEHAVVAKGNNMVIQRYLLHLFQQANFNQYKTQGAQPGLSVAKLNEIKFFIPSLKEQSRIISILDTFEASISNLEHQLALREKQYEYYRNQLLTFE